MNKSIEFLKSLDDVWNMVIPEEVLVRAKRSLLDYIAVACAGAKFQEEKLDKYYDFSVPEKGDFKVIGTGNNFTLKEAVFLNGLNGHALDFDDGTNSGIIHLGSPIFSLLIPLAQRYKISVEDMPLQTLQKQTSVFAAAVQFARIEGILPAPESAHAIRVAIDEALKCKETGEAKNIVFGLTGTGYFDMVAYEKYHDGQMTDYIPTDEELAVFRAKLPQM